MRLSLYLGQRQASALQDYENLINLASMVFGDGKNASSTGSAGEAVQSKEELQMAFKSVFG